MLSKILGELRVDDAVDEWLVSGPIPIPFFENQELRFVLDEIIDDDSVPDDIEDAIRHFLSLTVGDRNHATAHVVRNYEWIVAASAKHGIAIPHVNVREIWKHVHPSEIFLSRRDKDQRIYVSISAECDWEREHGLQLVFRNGSSLSRVSSQDGHLTRADAFGVPESEDGIHDQDFRR